MPDPDGSIASGEGGRDELFAAPRADAKSFAFDEATAEVFDDMLGRSVPLYDEVQRLVVDLVGAIATEGSRVYDLGCSTGTTLLALDGELARERGLRFVGVDASRAMLDRATRKLAAHRFGCPVEMVEADLNDDLELQPASMVLMILTLQFVRPPRREDLLRRIHDCLEPGGGLVLVEKVLSSDGRLDRMFIDHYYVFKRRQGYSQLEIAQKREALENVLVPYRLEENHDLLRKVGFKGVDTFYKWLNFAGIIATK